MQYELYFLYADPIKGMRTGHAALAVIHEGKIIRYFSMYPASLPDDVKKLFSLTRCMGMTPSCFVTVYENDVIMRGQSIARLSKNQKENIAVSDILKQLASLDEDTKEMYFDRGQFHHVLKLPTDVFVTSVVIKALKYITHPSNSSAWALCAPLTNFIDPDAYNCCSSISFALSIGKKEIRNDSPSVLAFTFYGAYFMILYAMQNHKSEGLPSLVSLFLYLPAIYPAVQLLCAIIQAFLYAKDLVKMAKRPPNILTLATVYTLAMIVNILGSPFSNNLCFDLLSFPDALARSLKTIHGVEEMKTLPSFFTTRLVIEQQKVVKSSAAPTLAVAA